MGVEAFGRKAAVEGLDDRVVGRLAGAGEVQCDALIGHRSRSRDSLPRSTRIVVGNPTSCRPFSNTSTTSVPAEGQPRRQGRREAGEGIDCRKREDCVRSPNDWSWTKSIALVSFDRVAVLRSSRSLALAARLGALLRNCRRNSR